MWGDFLKGFEKHTTLQTYYLAAMYQALQQREAEKTPGDWRPLYLNLHNPVAGIPVQILGKEDNRKTVSIYNGGPSIVLLSNKMFDAKEVLNRYSGGGNYNEAIPISPIAINSTQTLETTGPVYGYCVGIGSGPGNENAQLTIIESLYQAWEGAPGQHVNMPGKALADLAGYEPQEAMDRSILERLN